MSLLNYIDCGEIVDRTFIPSTFETANAKYLIYWHTEFSYEQMSKYYYFY